MMKLVHYSAAPAGPLRVMPQEANGNPNLFKPRGFWVSDDACEDNWRAWCERESFRPESLLCASDVELAPGANILLIRTAADIDRFTREWCIRPYPEIQSNIFVNWRGVRERYQGMIVTPYIWSRRLCMGDTPDAMWYYTWDCASGCIWDPAAIASVRLR